MNNEMSENKNDKYAEVIDKLYGDKAESKKRIHLDNICKVQKNTYGYYKHNELGRKEFVETGHNLIKLYDNIESVFVYHDKMSNLGENVINHLIETILANAVEILDIQNDFFQGMITPLIEPTLEQSLSTKELQTLCNIIKQNVTNIHCGTLLDELYDDLAEMKYQRSLNE